MKKYSACLRPLIVFATLLAAPAVSLVAAEGSEPPVPVRTVAPEVPQNFSRAGGSGLVTVSFMVDEKGVVQDPTVDKTSNIELNEPALKAIRKWRFKPAKKDGIPVAVRVAIPIKFDVES